jgi:membrane protein DedA with SNARE-associated domain
MGLVSELAAALSALIISVIDSLGLPGVFVLMAGDSMATPIPSEVVMAFAGFLAAQGSMNFWAVVIVGTLGALAGSLVAYYIGLYGGRAAVLCYGKRFISPSNLDMAEDWFDKHGEKTVFFARLLPVVRSLISFPAGAARMNVGKFALFTFLGALPWNFATAYFGFVAGENWPAISDHLQRLDFLIIIAGLAVLGAWVWLHRHEVKRHVRRLARASV